MAGRHVIECHVCGWMLCDDPQCGVCMDHDEAVAEGRIPAHNEEA